MTGCSMKLFNTEDLRRAVSACCPRAHPDVGDPGECCPACDVWHSLNALPDRSITPYAEGASDGGKQGHAEERKRIADWLRQQDKEHAFSLKSPRYSWRHAAEEIEDGQHWRTPHGKEPF
jgi:hypothetical protein